MRRILRVRVWGMLVCVLTLCGLAGGCLKEHLPPGVVAQVNGESITLRELEALQDVTGAGRSLVDFDLLANTDRAGALRPGKQDEAVEALRAQHGQTLSELVVQKLMRQALEKEGLGVSPEELMQAEEEIRADYPEDEFQKAFQEEYIDEDTWREFLHLRLSVLRFQERVLRPALSVSAQEVEAWYRDHEAEFRLPARVDVTLYAGLSKEQMDAVRSELVAGKTPQSGEQLTCQTLRVPLERLAPQWRQDMKGIEPRKPTPTRQMDGLFQVLVLNETVPARTLNVVQAYPFIEQVLVEEKMEPVLENWLKNAVKTAKILVAASLLPRDGVK